MDKKRRRMFFLQAALGALLLAKALIVPLPLPPNTGFVRPWLDATWLHQYRHWHDQVAKLEATPSAERGSIWTAFHSMTVAQLEDATTYLFAGSILGVLLIMMSFLWIRKSERRVDHAGATW